MDDDPSIELREEDEQTQKLALKLARDHVIDVLEALSKKRDELKQCLNPEDTADVVRQVRMLRSAIENLFRERDRIDQSRNDFPDEAGQADIDFEAARDQIRSRLARIRDSQ